MGICQSGPKLNGIIDNQSSYEIIYHISGSRKQLSDYEQQINVGPKLGVGFEGVEMEGINYNRKKYSRNEKYRSEARVPKHSFCSVGLNNIDVGNFLSIYATKQKQKGKPLYRKLIFKDICIRTNQDICIRINKDLTLKQLTARQIEEMKKYFQKQGQQIISILQETTDQLKSVMQSNYKQKPPYLKSNKQYLRRKFGQLIIQRYLQFQDTGFYDLNHMNVKMDMKEFLKYDWASLQSLQLDGCGINDDSWYLFSSSAQYFPNLQNIYLADNKITTIAQGDLEQFHSLKTLELDYSETQGLNPLTEQSKRYLFNFAIQHPQVLIYCANIDQTKYMAEIYPNQQWMASEEDQDQNQNQNNYENPKETNQKEKGGWFFILSPETNSTRNQDQNIRKSKTPKIGKNKNQNVKWGDWK